MNLTRSNAEKIPREVRNRSAVVSTWRTRRVTREFSSVRFRGYSWPVSIPQSSTCCPVDDSKRREPTLAEWTRPDRIYQLWKRRLTDRWRRYDATLVFFLNASSCRILRFPGEHLRSALEERRRSCLPGEAKPRHWGFWMRMNLNRTEQWWGVVDMRVILTHHRIVIARWWTYCSKFFIHISIQFQILEHLLELDDEFCWHSHILRAVKECLCLFKKDENVLSIVSQCFLLIHCRSMYPRWDDAWEILCRNAWTHLCFERISIVVTRNENEHRSDRRMNVESSKLPHLWFWLRFLRMNISYVSTFLAVAGYHNIVPAILDIEIQPWSSELH